MPRLSSICFGFAVFLVTVAAAPTSSDAQVPQECRGECSQDFEECKRDCVDGRNFDACVESCRDAHSACLGGCEADLRNEETPSECRGNCSRDHEDCRRSCVGGRNFDACVQSCREAHTACLSVCR